MALERKTLWLGGMFAVIVGCAAIVGLTPRRGAAAAKAQYSPGTEWTVHLDFEGAKVWTRDDPSVPLISLMENQESDVGLPPASDQELVKETEAGRVIANLVSGARHWKISGIQREALPYGPKVILTGDYTDGSGVRVAFEEWQFFTKKGFADLVYTQKSAATLDRAKVRSLLQSYVPFEGG